MQDLLQSLGIQECEYGADHCEASPMNLGNAYGDVGDFSDLVKFALVIQELQYGLDHRKVAATLTYLGNAYGLLGDGWKKRDLLQCSPWSWLLAS